MDLPPIVHKYATYVEDVSADHNWEFTEMADFAAGQVPDSRDRAQLQDAIDSLLRSDLDDPQLNQLWSKTNAGVKFKRDGTRQFLKEWRYALEHRTRRYSL
jgi:hypothetical protein